MKNTQIPAGRAPEETPAPDLNDAQIGGARSGLRIVRGLRSEIPRISKDLGEVGRILAGIYREAEIAAEICGYNGHKDLGLEIVSRAGHAMWAMDDLVGAEDPLKAIEAYARLREMLGTLEMAMRWASEKCRLDIDEQELYRAVKEVVKAAEAEIKRMLFGEGSK